MVYAQGPHRAARPLHIGETNRLDASADLDLRPDIALGDGEVVSGDGWTLEAVTTPGHTANHLAYALRESDLLFSGDHVMAWSTSIVAPPDGAMSDYMDSLAKLARRSEPIYLPGHGGLVREAPRFARSDDRRDRVTRRTSRPWCGRSISGAVRASPARHRSRCSRISKTWSRAARSRPRERRRSAAPTAWGSLPCPPRESVSPAPPFSPAVARREPHRCPR